MFRPLWRRKDEKTHQVVLYGKPGCHLCDDAAQLLERLARKHHLEITEIDITSDPELFRRYDIFIPVIVIDGETELRAPIEESELKRCLASSGR